MKEGLLLLTGYLGTYNTTSSKGIYQFSFDEQSGKITDIHSILLINDSKCVVLSDGVLISSINLDDESGIALFDAKTHTLLDSALYEHKTPCFIKYYNHFIYTANYHDGVVMVYKLISSTLKLVKRIDIKPKAGCHQVILHDHYLIVPCLLLDEIRIFDMENDFQLVKTLKFDHVTGPRHGIFNHDHTRFYLVSELSSEFFVYQVNGLDFKLLHKLPLLPQDKVRTSSTAAIRLTKNEQYIYVSTRGADLLTVIDVTKETPVIIQQTNCGGSHPRDFILSPDEKYLLVANRDSDNFVSFALDQATGKITDKISEQSVPHAVGITLENVAL